jgi:hypothetical protein
MGLRWRWGEVIRGTGVFDGRCVIECFAGTTVMNLLIVVEGGHGGVDPPMVYFAASQPLRASVYSVPAKAAEVVELRDSLCC